MKGLSSASDLIAYVRCPHLARLTVQGERPPPSGEDARLLQEKGRAHEQAFLESLPDCVTVPRGDERATRAALAAGAPWIYHGTLSDRFRVGEPDFLRRVDLPSDLGSFSYIPLDTKLGRKLKPEYVLQLCHYAELMAPVLGYRPAVGEVVLGDGSTHCVPLREYQDYYLNLFEAWQGFRAAPPETEPYPVPHCGLCGFQSRCEAHWEAVDHLCRVMDIRRAQVDALKGCGVNTLVSLSEVSDDRFQRRKGLTRDGFEKLRRQAQAQRSGQWEVIAPEILRALPPPASGDLFFDMESDPHFGENGLEYLFGIWVRQGEASDFKAFWAHSAEEEKQALERTVDFFHEFRALHPGMHIYHYNAYEPNHLVDLSSRHGTREAELDALLREGVFVDLLPVVRRGLIVPTESRSLKALEPLIGFERGGELKGAAASIVYYERWLETGEGRWLTEIERYNREDVRATAALYDWLRGLE